MYCKNYPRFTGAEFYTEKIRDLLSAEEREKAYKNDFSFLGSEKKKQQVWDDEYNRKIDALKKGALNDVIGGPAVLELLMLESTYSGKYPLASKFQMSQRPDAPEDEYLSCWHDLWIFKQDDTLLHTLNNKTKCPFFFSYNKKGNKSFDGCEKERVALQDKNRFIITNLLVIAGIIVTIITALITYFIK